MLSQPGKWTPAIIRRQSEVTYLHKGSAKPFKAQRGKVIVQCFIFFFYIFTFLYLNNLPIELVIMLTSAVVRKEEGYSNNRVCSSGSNARTIEDTQNLLKSVSAPQNRQRFSYNLVLVYLLTHSKTRSNASVFLIYNKLGQSRSRLVRILTNTLYNCTVFHGVPLRLLMEKEAQCSQIFRKKFTLSNWLFLNQ